MHVEIQGLTTAIEGQDLGQAKLIYSQFHRQDGGFSVLKSIRAGGRGSFSFFIISLALTLFVQLLRQQFDIPAKHSCV